MNRTLPHLLLILLTLGLAVGAEDPAVPLAPVPAAPAAPVTPATPTTRAEKGPDKAALLKQTIDVSAAGIDRRLGPDWNDLRKASTKERAAVKKTDDKPKEDKAKDEKAGDKFPQIWLAAAKKDAAGRPYQIGGPWAKESGDYSSAQGQVLFAASGGMGIDRVTVIEWANGCFIEKPELPWWGGFHPEPHTEPWGRASGGVALGMARGIGMWSNCGVMVFPNGLIATAGTCTAVGSNPVFQLPPGKVPTAICVTNKNEFALVTVCDVKDKMKGQVAVLALTGMKKDFAHEWQIPHPGLPSVAMLSGIKLIGFVDLPGISIPTAISAVGNGGPPRHSGPSGNVVTLRELDLGNESIRNSFTPKGNNAGIISTAGWAVVAAGHEGKVVFIDLQPLFARYYAMYFGGAESYAKTRDQGPEPKQWPYTFEIDPTAKPVVIAVQKVPEPTAVLAGLGRNEKARAYVACRDGRVAVFKVGNLATAQPVASADEIALVEAVTVGRNPVSLAYHRYASDQIIVVCRGERSLDWIKTTDGGSTMIRRLRDERLIDPVQCEVVETHGIETSLLTVCDFKGGKIINYRFSEVIFATNGGARFGMGKDGKDEFECGGWLEFPGPPFAICATNVN
jgi:hypothetical protein